MSMRIKEPTIHGGLEDIKKSTNKSIRLFTVGGRPADSPLGDVTGSWVECSPETVKNFSAVRYYFGRKINNETGYPVGLICSASGGTYAQAWTRIDYIKNDDALSPMIGIYEAAVSKWEEACLEAEKNQKPKPRRKYGTTGPVIVKIVISR